MPGWKKVWLTPLLENFRWLLTKFLACALSPSYHSGDLLIWSQLVTVPASYFWCSTIQLPVSFSPFMALWKIIPLLESPSGLCLMVLLILWNSAQMSLPPLWSSAHDSVRVTSLCLKSNFCYTAFWLYLLPSWENVSSFFTSFKHLLSQCDMPGLMLNPKDLEMNVFKMLWS
jgi:hypothetical protein